MIVVPARIAKEFLPYRFDGHRNEELPKALLLHRSDESLDDGEAGRLAEKPESDSYSAPLTPPLVRSADELPSLRPLVAYRSAEKRLHLLGRRDSRKHCEADEAAGDLVNDDGHPPAEGPALRQREGKPPNPETRSCGDRRQVEMPHLPWMPSDGPTPWSPSRRDVVVERTDRLTYHPADCRCTQVQAGFCEHVGHTLGPHRREQELQLAHEVPDEVRVAVHRLSGLNERGLTMLVEATHPQLHRVQVEQEDVRSLLERPAPRRP
jgi:hypothetical protein